MYQVDDSVEDCGMSIADALEIPEALRNQIFFYKI